MRKKDKLKIGGSKRRTTSVIAIGFLLIIFTGALLLMHPAASADGKAAKPMDAMFTAVSATCVTGLVTLDTATEWSVFGQIVILIMIQIGGLGFMTVAVLLSLLIKRSVTPRERMLVAMSYNINRYDKLGELINRIGIGTFCIEAAGAVLLSVRFIPLLGAGKGIYTSVFLSVSAFCNAGFDLLGSYSGPFSSLTAFVDDPLVNFTMMFLICVGGIGFIVWNDVINSVVKKKRLSVYSKFVLLITAVLIFGGTFLFCALEWNNPETLGSLDPGQKIMAAMFQSVTLRTAGFNSIPQEPLKQSSQLISILLMFIGGCSGSTAGGVKTGTIGVLACCVWCATIGRKQAAVFKRTITDGTFMRAVSVVTVQILIIVFGTFSVATLSDVTLLKSAFEVTSAAGTVGMSLGITTSLNTASKLIVMATMYLGRVGILTVTYALMLNLSEKQSLVTYPDANMLIG